MTPKSAHQKGKLLEDYIVHRFVLTGIDTRASRNPGSGSGMRKSDVWTSVGLAIEAKNTKSCSLKAFWNQAVRESMGTTIPCVVWHMPQEPLENSLAIIPWYYFEELLIKSKDPKTAEKIESRADADVIRTTLVATKNAENAFEEALAGTASREHMYLIHRAINQLKELEKIFKI